jgi:hypothetical protein
VEREDLDETTPLSDGELAVATRMLAALRRAGTVTADEVDLLDSTLLTQYVRGEFDDDMAKWEAQLLEKVEAGLLLRGRGIYDVDSGATMYPPGFTYADLLKGRVDLDERTHAAYITRLFGESDNGHLLHCERVMDVDIDALVAIPLEKVLLVRLQVGGRILAAAALRRSRRDECARARGRWARGRTRARVTPSAIRSAAALVPMPRSPSHDSFSASVCSVYCIVCPCQMLETIRTLKVRKSEAEGRRIFKHILILDLQGIPIRKLMFSSGARACIAAVLGVAEHFPETTHQIFLVNVPWLFHKVRRARPPSVHRSPFRARCRHMGSPPLFPVRPRSHGAQAYETFVKPRLTTMTMSKIKVFGNDAAAINAAMREAGIPQSAIPQYLNGENPGRSLLDISKELIDASAAAESGVASGGGAAAAAK